MWFMVRSSEFLSQLINIFQNSYYYRIFFQNNNTKFKNYNKTPFLLFAEEGFVPSATYDSESVLIQWFPNNWIITWNQWYWHSNIFLYMELTVSSIIWLNQLKSSLLKTSTAQGKESFLSRAGGGLLLCTLKCLLCSKMILGSVDWQQEKFSWQRRKPEEIHMQTKF